MDKLNLLKTFKLKEETDQETIKSLENNVHLCKMKLAEIINLAFESQSTDFIEKIENSILELETSPFSI